MSLFGLQSENDFLGVDIGTTTIKAAELNVSAKGNATLVNYAMLETTGYLERFNSSLQTSSLKLLDNDIIHYLKILVDKLNPKTRKVTASLPSFSAFTTLLELPVMSDREISQSISYQAKNYIPLPISSVTIDWVKVGEKVMPDGSKKQQVFLISVPNEQVEKYTYIFKQAGLSLQALEIESMSSARALTAGIEKPMLIIDIGGRSTAIAVAQAGALKFAGQTDFASGSLTQALSTALNIGSRRAEDLKRQSIFLGGGGERELSTIMLPIVDVIINEAKRIIASFENGYQDKVAGVLLCGSGANMHGLDAYIASQIGLPTKIASPFDSISCVPEIQPLTKSLGPTLTVAIGLCLKNFR